MSVVLPMITSPENWPATVSLPSLPVAMPSAVGAPPRVVAHTDPKREKEAQDWLVQQISSSSSSSSSSSLQPIAAACLAAWRALTEEKPFAEITVSNEFPPNINGKHIEAALLDRAASGNVHYRPLSFAQLK